MIHLQEYYRNVSLFLLLVRASRTYRIVLAGSTLLSHQYVLMNIRDHHVGVDHQPGLEWDC